MTQDQIFQSICAQMQLVIPELCPNPITPIHSLKGVGANSIDRAEIIMLMMSVLKVKIPLIEFAKAENIQGMIDTFYQHLNQAASINS